MIHKDDRMCGGFVWEWCDHAIAHGTAENGKTRYYYGGDHGETIHDGNFCVDGLVYPDRTPHTGLLEYKMSIVRLGLCPMIRKRTDSSSQLYGF